MREKEIKHISIVFDLRKKMIELFSTEIKTGGLGGNFFSVFGGSRNKKFHVGHVEFETTIRLPNGDRYSFGCTYLEFRTIS